MTGQKNMSEGQEKANMAEEIPIVENEENELPQHWKQVQGAIWLIGIAILAFRGWWWPGILILVAISGLAEAGIRLYVNAQEQKAVSTAEAQALEEKRATILPDKCPNCGSPATMENVEWIGPLSAKCSFCGTVLTA